nr:hypothetical protein [Mycobacterium sp.]
MIWSIYLRNQDLPEGGDNLARILLLFMVFTVSNAYLAPGAKRRRATLESTSRRRPAIPLPHNAAARAMLVQIAVLYFVAGYLKATADIWSKRATLRKLVTVSLAGMHLGIMVRMGLVAFGLIMIGADSMILTDHDYQTVTGRIRRAAGTVLGRRDRTSDRPTTPTDTAPVTPPPAAPAPTRPVRDQVGV